MGASAQSNINSLYVPLQDEVITYKLGSNRNAAVGAAGNQTWDFSTTTYLTTTTMTFADPDFTSNGATYPSANFSFVDMSGANYVSWTGTTKTWYGYASTSNSDYTLYSNPITLYSLPLVYGVSSTADTYAGTEYDGSETYAITGTATTTYDGYGTIVTNYGTYTNVVRVKTSMVEQKVKQSNAEITDYTLDRYDWYTSSGKLVYRIDHATSESPSLSLEAKFLYSFSIPVTSILEDRKIVALTAKPNPASEEVTIDLKSIPSGNYAMSIQNSMGVNLVQENMQLANGEEKRIPLYGLSEGVYVVFFVSEQHRFSVNVVKQ